MRTLVMIPTYNEAGNILSLVEQLQLIHPDLEILVIDDGSPDGTADLVEGRVHLLRRSEKAGLAKAYIAAMEWALERNYEVLIQMDADGSHLPSDLAGIKNAMDGADLVIGSRWVSGGATRNWPMRRRLLSRFGSRYASVVLGLKVKDATSGYRGYRASILRLIDLNAIESNGFSFQIEMTSKARGIGARIVETPITFMEREHGQSKMTLAIAVEALFRVTRWALCRLSIFAAKQR